jgi:F-type H+-transporting ATPase subunit 8
MPQVPFFFYNQVIVAFFLLVLISYVVSKYILPRFVHLFKIQIFIQNFNHYFTPKNFTKHFTLKNILVAILLICITGVVKFSGISVLILSFCFEVTSINE